MCRPTVCRRCGKTTWAGCGMHVTQVMAHVPKADRCAGHADEPKEPGLIARWLSGRR